MTTAAQLSLAPSRTVSLVLTGANGTLTLNAGQGLSVALDPILRGPKGDKGDTGLQGDVGPAGAAGGTGYVFQQSTAASTWSIAHALNRFPSVTVVDSAGSIIEGDVRYVDANHITLNFGLPFSGAAYLN